MLHRGDVRQGLEAARLRKIPAWRADPRIQCARKYVGVCLISPTASRGPTPRKKATSLKRRRDGVDDGGSFAPRPAPAVGAVPAPRHTPFSRLLAIDDAPTRASYRLTRLYVWLGECWGNLAARLQSLGTLGHRGAAFVTAVASKVFQ